MSDLVHEIAGSAIDELVDNNGDSMDIDDGNNGKSESQM